jgi:penicillin-binding protein 2
MIKLPQDRRPPMTPQLAFRVAVIGSLALAMFAIIFFRLWFLQVLSGQQYLAQANTNQTREIAIPAPRGEILDSSGNVLVDSVEALEVQISPPNLPVRMDTATLVKPPPADAAVYDRLAWVLHMSTQREACRVVGYGTVRLSPIGCDVAQQQALLPYASVTVTQRTNVNRDVQYYIAERSQLFPGVSVEQVYQRHYPLNDTAAQLFGTIGPINPQEVHESRFKGVPENSTVGQSGLEWTYDRYLRGEDGSENISVNSLGQFEGYRSKTPPVPGHNLRLSLDVNLEKAGDQALQESIDANPPSQGGAFVAMNPDNGAVYAMGSLPSYNANDFAKPISETTYKQLNNPSSNFPLLNRAIQSVGPTGSTFKPITATAALESGVWSLDQTYDDTGQYCIDGQCRHNSGGAANGVLNLVNAIRVSDDVFFYNLGALTNADPATHPNGGALDQWASKFGIGRKTGIDLPGEAPGNLPTPAWRNKVNQLEAECDNATGPFKGKRKHAPGGCGIADGTNRPWSVGDNINLAVGQGDVQATPLQLAVVYAALANGGTIVRPHLGLDIEEPDGTVLQKISPPPARHININPQYLAAIRQGLRDAASSPGGTSDDVMGNFREQVYGKTGTAQYVNNGVEQDYAWYACFVPSWATGTPIVVVVWVEQGGFGDIGAAPVARQILSQWFFGKKGSFVTGNSHTL